MLKFKQDTNTDAEYVTECR